MTRNILSSIALLLLLGASAASAGSKGSYGDLTGVRFVKNYDGDTITVNLEGQHPLFGEEVPVRVFGIDTPEIKGKCEQEKQLAREAQKAVRQLLNGARNIRLKNVQRDKYFRILADIDADGTDVADELIQQGLAVPYDGGTKTFDWCKDRPKAGKRSRRPEQSWLERLIDLCKQLLK